MSEAGPETPTENAPVQVEQTTETKTVEPAQWDGRVESLPEPVQKMIRDARKVEGDERVAKKTLDAIQKALNPDAGDDKPDPVKLAEQLTERQREVQAREAEAKQAKTELAVFRLAGKTGADADALLDSRGFLAKLGDIDPTDDNAIKALVEEWVRDKPKFRSARVAGQSGADFGGGSGEDAMTQDKFNALSNSEKNDLYKTKPDVYRRFSGA